MVRRQEADEESGESAVGRLGQPRRAREVLEPQARQELRQVPPAPPVVDDANDRGVVVLRRPSERDAVEPIASVEPTGRAGS